MQKQTNWRALLLEDFLVVTLLFIAGLAIVLVKLVPALARWARYPQ